MGNYTRRHIDDELDELFGELPAVLLDGPKGVGKTTTALRRVVRTHRLDVPAEREVVAAGLEDLASSEGAVLIDEWQRMPEVFDAVKRAVDADPTGGRFLLTGSALTEVTTHSGAGRITPLRMWPLSFHERLGDGTVSLADLVAGIDSVSGFSTLTLADYAEEITKSGFPALRGLGERARNAALDGYLDQVVTKDFASLGRQVRNPQRALGLLRSLSASVSTNASLEKIRLAAVSGEKELAKTTALDYLDLLTGLRIYDPLPAWTPSNNHLGQLHQAPTHHLADPALAARLVRRGAAALARGSSPQHVVPYDGSFLGLLFESLTVLTVRPMAQALGGKCYHFRDSNGRREVDLIVVTDSGITAIEVKLAAAVADAHVTHLNWLRDRLGSALTNRVVITTGPEAYRRADGVLVVPLGLLTP
jgi:predicted AAA+ superfamily ATPase